MSFSSAVWCRRAWLLLAGVLVAGCLEARTDPPRLMSEQQLQAFVSDLLTWPDHGVLAWYGGAKGEKAVRLQRLDNTLNTWSRPIVLTNAARESFEPRLAAFGKDILVTWYEKDPDSGAFNALIARLDWAGQPHWYDALSHPGAGGRHPVVRVAGETIWAAWLQPEDRGEGVWAVQLGADGRPLGPAQRVGAADAETTNLNAAVDGTGTFYLVFDARLKMRARELQLVTVSASGAQQRVLTADDGVDSVFPDIAIEGEHVALCWVDGAGDARAVRLAASSLADLNAPLDARARSLPHERGEVGGSYLAWNQGRLAVAWNVAQPTSAVYVQRFDAHGRPTAAATPLPSLAPELQAAVPAIAAWQRGFALGWNVYLTDEAGHAVVRSAAQLAVRD